MRYLFALLSFLFTPLCMGQGVFITKAPESVGIKNNFEVKYVLTNADSDELIEPVFEGFEVIEGPVVKKRTIMQFNGSQAAPQITVTFTYTLNAKQKGQLTIPGASIVVEGETIKSDPTTINVTGKSGVKGKVKEDTEVNAPKVSRQNKTISETDFYCTSSVNRRQLYEQEYLVVTYNYHSKIGTDATHVNPNTRPSFTYFLAEEVEVHEDSLLASTTKTGELVRTGTALQYILSPQQSGRLTIPGVLFDCDLTQRDLEPASLEEFFEGENFINVKAQRKTQDVSIDVLPLPLPRPSDFSGGVGHFSLVSSIDTSTPKAGEVDTLRIIIKGIGNHKLVKAPTIVFPSDFDTFDVKLNDKTEITPNGLSGEVVFNYAFIPLNAGEYHIPCISISYFDTSTREYVTLTSDSILINVVPSIGPQRKNDEIHDIHLSSDNKDSLWSAITWLGTWTYYLALLLITSICSVAISLGKRYKEKHADAAILRRNRAKRTAITQLKKLRKNAANLSASEFNRLLSESFREFVAAKFLTIENSLTNDGIIGLLQNAAVDTKLVHSTKELLESIDFAQFAASTESKTESQLIEEAINLVNSLDTNIEIIPTNE